MKPEIEADIELYVVTDVFYRRIRGTDKNHPGQSLPDKKPREQLIEIHIQGVFVRLGLRGGDLRWGDGPCIGPPNI